MTDAPLPLPGLVDSHCHLDFPQLAADLPDVLARARAAGVERMVTICTRLRSEPQVRALAETHGFLYAAGTHPMSAHEEPLATVDQLVALARHPRMVAIGETGLDYHYTAETKAVQQTSLRVHIEAAQETGLPLVIHARDADDDMAAILTEGFSRKRYACVMHCFSSGEALARTALDLGFYLSASGITAFPRSDALRAIFKTAPLDRILLETDAPYLAPPPHRGKRNEPAFVTHTARAIAPLWDVTPEAFALATTQNFDRLFTKAAALKAAA